MLHWTKRIIAPPVFEDENLTRKARLLNAMLVIILVGALAGMPILFILDPANALLSLLLLAPVAVIVAGSLYRVHRGHLEFASVSLAAVLFVTAACSTWFYAGIRGLTDAYFLVIIVTSLLSSRNTTLVFGALCLLAMSGVYVAEVVGLIAFPELPPLRLASLVLVGIAFCIAVFLLQVGAQNLTQALAQSRHNEQVLAERTAELAESHANLEREMAVRMQIEQDRARLQQQLIRELSTPIIPVMDAPGGAGGIIVMPLVGSIDDVRARDITRALLVGIRQHRAKVVILDITGVPLVDSDVMSHLNKTIQAARLKGARTIITGISDAVAETIVDLGIDWSKTDTLSNLQTGLLVALKSMGIELLTKTSVQGNS